MAIKRPIKVPPTLRNLCDPVFLQALNWIMAVKRCMKTGAKM
jgi:hypothetical protein